MHFGLIEEVGRVTRGWAVDLTAPGQPASLILVVDGQPVATVHCTEARPDVNALGFKGIGIGFTFEMPAVVLDMRKHWIALRFRDGVALPRHSEKGEVTGDIEFRYQPLRATGMIDGMFGAAVRGWAFQIDERTNKRTGLVDIEVFANGVRIDRLKADLVRNDVADVHGCDPQCGFLYPVPVPMRNGRPFVLEFHAGPEGAPLHGSPFSGQTLVRDSLDQLHAMRARVEQLCTEMYALKDQLRNMTTADEFSLDTYHGWAGQYFDALRARVVAARRDRRHQDIMAAPPKVSVLVPTYKPDLGDFAAAIESVRSQSWTNWELIIVDDGSGLPALTGMIKEYCAKDDRIRAAPMRRNGGISAATNAAVKAATGDYIAFFDHDDLLVDVALEVMVLAARGTGAPVLYSDEDKIDSRGKLSEPHLKSDWNYRLALSNNYVCHLLMVEAATLRAVGPLDPRYDGAQDHDLVLRLGEAVGPSGIHHVAEILYHWRKTANSTASRQSSKGYAVEAGRTALLHHVARRGLVADVTAPYGSTLYDVRFRFTAEPKVAIVIPFKDQVATTRRCVASLLETTAYGNYEIVLVDNWSSDPDTMEWLASLADVGRVRVIRVEERFNYSRINNLAVRQLTTDYLVFLNNDVFVTQADWLRLLMNEALADPAVAIVGNKLLYPNGSVQHAGVVLGVGGVADHTFRFAAADDRGYSYRAVVAQELSAVTAASMLCRADIFREVGMFDEDKLTVAFNDVDLCLKVGRAGYKVVFTPAVMSDHHESLSRGNDLAEHNQPRFFAENQAMMDRWRPLITRDPFYNPNFSHEDGIFLKLSNVPLDPALAQPLFPEPAPARPNTRPPPLDHVIEPAAAEERSRRRKTA